MNDITDKSLDKIALEQETKLDAHQAKKPSS